MDCFFVTVKYFIFVINIFISMAGIGLVAVGSYSYSYFMNKYDLSEGIDIDLVRKVLIAVIVGGCVIFLIAFTGCTGAGSENKVLLLMFATFMLLLAIVSIAGTIDLFKNMNMWRENVETLVNDAFEEADQAIFHGIEVQLKCCGTTGPGSYPGTLPPSCCGITTGVDWDEATCTLQNAYPEGCTDAFWKIIKDIFDSIKKILICFIVYELVTAAATLYMFRYIQMKRLAQVGGTECGAKM